MRFSRKFYEEFLGLEVVQTSDISLMIRLGGKHCIAVVYTKRSSEMGLLNHNGLDVETQEEVDEAHRVALANAEKWKLQQDHRSRCCSTAPTASTSGMPTRIAGKFSPIPKDGYDWLFRNGDMTGKGHHDRNFKRPGVKI